MKKKKPTIPSIIKWVIALILVVMQVYPFFYVFTSSFKSLDDFRPVSYTHLTLPTTERV